MQIRTSVAEFVDKLVEDDEIIDSAQMVTERYHQATGHEVKVHFVREVMRQDCQLKFKKIRMTSVHENSVQNIVLR